MVNKSTRVIVSITINVAIIIFAIVLISTAGTKAFNFGNKVFNEEAADTNSAKQVQISIENGISTQKLADILYANGLIEDKLVFITQVELSDYKDKFKAGTYSLNPSMMPSEIMETLSQEQTSTAASSEN